MASCDIQGRRLFQSTPLRKRRSDEIHLRRWREGSFNPRPLRGAERPHAARGPRRRLGFNPRPPPKGSEFGRVGAPWPLFQSTPPPKRRERRRTSREVLKRHWLVSIHAPRSEGAESAPCDRDERRGKVSIHALRKRRRHSRRIAPLRPGVRRFNPPPPKRRATETSGSTRRVAVSIHAPSEKESD